MPISLDALHTLDNALNDGNRHVVGNMFPSIREWKQRAPRNSADDIVSAVTIPQVFLVRDTNPLFGVRLGNPSGPNWILILVLWGRAKIDLRPNLSDPSNTDNNARRVFIKRIPMVAVIENKGVLWLKFSPESLEKLTLAVRLENPTITSRIVWPSK
ncbi:MAG TPA: hypothetical protein P5119_07190 [Candidatus Aminicenantes bacterium]|nr:hypothetical protein [Candidatus Aminicenantes bacterium]HRZ72419.1 hypothetical protein [Candidatus Aminicenantes bacterium]